MTSKIYRSSQGKPIDLGTIMLQNEQVRAVGNMNVNARGDKLDSTNQVIETRSRQIQRQTARTTNVSADPVHTSTLAARRDKKEKSQKLKDLTLPIEQPVEVLAVDPIAAPPLQETKTASSTSRGGLAAAIARSREVKQELEKTRQQQQQTLGLKKL
jgi:hypothetical protein